MEILIYFCRKHFNSLKKILLIRFSSIGDIVLTTPVVRALKEQLNCKLHVLTKKQYQFLFSNNTNVDVVHSFENNIKETISQLKVENFDFIVDLQKSLRSIKIIKNLKKPNSSFTKLNVEKWLLVNFKINKLPNIHIVERYFEAVKTLGVLNDNKGLEYYYPHSELINPNTIHADLTKGFIAFVIGGQHFTKIMPAEKVASIISKLNLPVLLLGGPEDKLRGDEIVELAKNNLVINTCGKYSLNGSASLIEQAGLVITNDTGLMHIAAAFKKPIISLWGNTVPEFGMYPYLPNNKEKFVIAEVKNLNCRPCSKIGHKKCPKTHFKCMLNQDEEFIVKSASKLLKSN